MSSIPSKNDGIAITYCGIKINLRTLETGQCEWSFTHTTTINMGDIARSQLDAVREARKLIRTLVPDHADAKKHLAAKTRSGVSTVDGNPRAPNTDSPEGGTDQ